MKDVSRLLVEARLGAGLTQQEVASRAGTSQPTVAAYEAGRRTPTLPTLARLFGACDRDLIIDAHPVPPSGPVGRPTLSVVRRHRRELLAAAAGQGVTDIRVFGSLARDSGDAGSDVDLLVELEPGRTLADLASFRADAAAILGTPVDVATADLLKPAVRAEALREAVPL